MIVADYGDDELASPGLRLFVLYRVEEVFIVFGRSTPPTEPTRKSEPAAQPPAASGGFMSAAPVAAAAVTGPRPAPQASPGGVATSVIGKDLHIAGERIIIICQSRLQVDGEIVGDLAGREVIIGESAKVTGAVSAESIEVRGKVNGGIRGAHVALRPSARVEGDIVHKVLTIAEGAQFDGRVRRAKDDSEVKPPLEIGPASSG
jgi:cytoskeletal protein CcmA (bactofilin family)